MNYIISQPRSGQHLTQRFLKFYSQKKDIDFSYCEFYSHCKTVPCKEGRLFQKNHDSGQAVVNINSEDKYLVLYRSNFIEQCEAIFRFWETDIFPRKQQYSNDGQLILMSGDTDIIYTEDQEDKLKAYIKKHIHDYIKFLDKWVLNRLDNICKIPYEKILENPYVLKKIVYFFYKDTTNIEEIIDEFQKTEPIIKQHNIKMYNLYE